MKLMNGKKIFAAALFVVAIFTGAQSFASVKTVVVNGQERPAYRDGEVIVKYRDDAVRTSNTMVSLYQRLSVKSVKRFNGHFKNFEHLMIDANRISVEDAVADLNRDSSVEYAQPNYMIYAFKDQQPKRVADPCMIPGVPFPPGCDDSGGGGTPPPGNGGGKQPCIIPGIPFPPGCDDSGGGGGGGGGAPNPPPAANRPAIAPAPAEVNPPVADPDMAQAYGISKVAADKAWAVEKGSKSMIVAVIDTGIDYNHKDLAYNIWRNPNSHSVMRTGIDPSGSDIAGDVVGWDFIHNDNLPFDDNEHGTHCAGVIGAVGGNGIGISGINQRVSVMAVKFLSGEGSGDTAGAIKGIDYAVSRGAKVLSNSWGGKGDDGSNGALKDAIKRAADAGVLFVAAAGNDGTDNDKDPTFPASFDVDNMVVVAATNETDGMAFFSNTGAKSVHVGAPGTNVYSTVPGDKYAKLSGTSMACPHVAGAAALLWSHFPKENYKQIKQRLMQFGDSLGALKGKTVSGNRINVLKSLQGSLSSKR